MALYIPASQRRRKLVVVAVVAALAGALLGLGLGRVTAPKAADQAAAAKDQAKRATGQLASLPLPYEKAKADPSSQAAFDASLASALTRTGEALDAAFADAPWIGEPVRTQLRARVAAVGESAKRADPPAGFTAAVDDAVAAIAAAFGEAAPAPGR